MMIKNQRNSVLLQRISNGYFFVDRPLTLNFLGSLLDVFIPQSDIQLSRNRVSDE